MGEGVRVSIITLGCRVNQAESDDIGASLRARGVDIVDIRQNPDYCIVNTCTVTAESDQNSRQLIRRAARLGAGVIVTGCYSQLRRAEVSSIEGVIGVYDNSRKDAIVDFLSSPAESRIAPLSGRCRPYIKVQDGCDFRCSYCAVPLARGRSRSVAVEDVIKRAVDLEAAGYREIVLTGIHLGTYGKDLRERATLPGLVRSLLDATRSCRIRLSSIEINEIDGALLDLLTDERICDHLHVPLQSGCDRILRMMRRNYSIGDFRSALERVITRVPHICIGSDVMVGFPGETDSDFRESLAATEDLPFAYLHAFPYSARPDTPAAAMDGQVCRSASRVRMSALRQADRKKRADYMARQMGRTLEIIVEEQDPQEWVVGTSSNFLKITVSEGRPSRGSLVSVRPTGIRNGHLHAEMIAT